jgi:iron/zinc/copper transport system permease protein
MIFLSAGLGTISSVVGLYFSFTYNLSSGASIVLVATALFALVFIFSPRHGLLRKWKLPKKELTP